MLAAAHVEVLAVVHVLLPMALLMIFAGSATPNAMAGAVRFHPEMAGTASGLSSAIGLVVGGSSTIISGSVYSGSFRPIGILIFSATVASMLSWLLASRPLRSSSSEST